MGPGFRRDCGGGGAGRVLPEDGTARHLLWLGLSGGAAVAAARGDDRVLLLAGGPGGLQSLRGGDAFGLSTRFVGADNFTALFADPDYLLSFGITAFFSVAVALLALAPGLLLAVMADRVVKGAAFYKTVLLLPYAIAPAIAGVLWMFLFNPSIGVLAAGLRAAGVDWNYLLNGGQAMALVILAAAWKQISYNFLFFVAGLQAIPPR